MISVICRQQQRDAPPRSGGPRHSRAPKGLPPMPAPSSAGWNAWIKSDWSDIAPVVLNPQAQDPVTHNACCEARSFTSFTCRMTLWSLRGTDFINGNELRMGITGDGSIWRQAMTTASGA